MRNGSQGLKYHRYILIVAGCGVASFVGAILTQVLHCLPTEKNWQVIPNPGSKCPRNPEPSSGRAHSNLLSRVLRSDQHQHCNRNGKCCVCLLNVPGKECILTEHTNRTDAMLIVMPFFLLKDTKISIWRQASLSPMLQNLGWHADMLVGKSRSASSSPSVCLSWL